MSRFLVAVTEPCTENRDEMTATVQGRNCMRCNKIVIDFTGLSDKEIIRHIKDKNNDNICGRFKDPQLNRWLFESELAKTNPGMYKYLAGLLLMLASQQISAQSHKAQVNPIEISPAPTGEKLHMVDPPANVTVSTTNSCLFTSSTIRIGGARSISSKNDPLLVINGEIVKLPS